jgi:transposase-like protein
MISGTIMHCCRKLTIISLYARGLITSEIQGHLEEIYGVEVSPELISTVTDGMIEEVRAWQGRPMEKTYGKPSAPRFDIL